MTLLDVNIGNENIDEFSESALKLSNIGCNIAKVSDANIEITNNFLNVLRDMETCVGSILTSIFGWISHRKKNPIMSLICHTKNIKLHASHLVDS